MIRQDRQSTAPCCSRQLPAGSGLTNNWSVSRRPSTEEVVFPAIVQVESVTMKTAGVWLVCLLVGLTSVTAFPEDNTDVVVDHVVGEATTEFTLNLIKHVFRSEPGNVFMSPISVESLLAMVQQGARSTTAQQLEHVLHLSANASRGFRHVIQNFQNRKYKSRLEFNNHVFVNNNFDLASDFRAILDSDFHSGVESLDFRSPSVALQRINSWVSQASKGRIPELLGQNAITQRTQMILANVIYFRGVWLRSFGKDETKSNANFYTSPNKNVKVTMMHAEQVFPGGSNDELGVRWVEIPYEGDDFAMILVLPKRKFQLAQVLQKMSATDFKAILATTEYQEVILDVPRFKLNSQVPVVPALKMMGLNDIFNQRSNLEGISLSKGPLVVSDIVHKAEIEVNEEGSIASGGSGLLVNTLSLHPNYERVNFTCDQPFLAIIVDKVNEIPLFVAKVVDPRRT